MTVELHIATKGESTCVAVLGEFEVEGLEELRARLEHREQSHKRPVLDLRRILAAVCDRVRVEDRDGSQWVELTKAIHTGARDG